MAAETLLKTSKHSKYISYRKILYHRFFVGLLVFIVISLVLSFVCNIFAGSAPRVDIYESVNLDAVNLPVTNLPRSGFTALPRVANCTYWNCFNVYKCGRGGHNKITIYIYPLKDYRTEEDESISRFSREFYEILHTIKNSRYYTSSPDEACLLVPSIDTLNQNYFNSEYVSRALQSLEHWNNGENHLIFNMVAGIAPNYNTVVDLNTSKAIIAGAGFNTWTFRYGFDISLPLYSHTAQTIDSTQPEQKNYMIISAQLNIPEDYLAELQSIASSSNDLLLLNRCRSNVDYKKRCEYTTGKEFNYPDVLKEGMFCLIVRSARLAQSILMDIIASQCIPIIIADTIVMPFNSHVDWNKIALFVPEENIRSLVKIVHSVSKERRGELYWQLRWVYERYFVSVERVTLTTLEIINEKLFPLTARMYEEWNMPEHLCKKRRGKMYWQLRWVYERYFASVERVTLTTLEIISEKLFPLTARMYEEWNMPEHLYGPVNPLFLPVTAPKSPGFTAVILTYDRVDSLFALVRKLVRTPSLAKILVVWNNQNKQPPPSSEWPVVSKPLKVIRTKQNKLSNRFYPYDEIETECQLTIDDDIVMLTPDELEFGFYPYDEIETECQLTIDDDIVMLTPDELEFGFDVWREFPDRIVGFPSRLHVWDNVTHSWKYHSEWTNQISMVLTGAAFHHKIWSWYYTYKMPAEIRTWVDDNFNCEDIAMNFLVANVTRKPPIKVTPRKKFKCPECTNTEMLSADARHMSQRSACIERFARIYGHMALKTVEFRADPLQYRETTSGIPHMYPDIGAL